MDDTIEIIDVAPEPRMEPLATVATELSTPPPVRDDSMDRLERTATITQTKPGEVTRSNGVAWGDGTDGWPRRGSRTVRLFWGTTDAVVEGALGRRWGWLRVGRPPHDHPSIDEATVLPARLWLPYPAPPLRVEVVVQPFDDRFTRVDVVQVSKRRYPRRLREISSRCLTRMQVLEVRPESVSAPDHSRRPG